MANRMPRRLLALSSSAVAAVYLYGLHATEATGLRAGATSVAGPVLQPASLTVPELSGATAPAAAAPATAPAAAPAAPATETGYRDGTYTGQGDSRRGGFQVAVTVQGGRIADVTITQAWTQYPASRVAALPAQVIARQSD